MLILAVPGGMLLQGRDWAACQHRRASCRWTCLHNAVLMRGAAWAVIYAALWRML